MKTIIELAYADVHPNPDQPRKVFEPVALGELAASIREQGLKQPPTVRPDPKQPGTYEIVCGERRWRACGLNGAKTIVCIVEEMTEDQRDDVAIIENLQRADISPLEEAHAFQRRLDAGLSVEELAKRLGVEVLRVNLRVALLQLAPEFQEAFSKGLIEQAQANQMARLNHGYQRLLFQAISEGRCKTRAALRAVTDALLKRQTKDDGSAPLKLTLDQVDGGGEQVSMFGAIGPTETQRAMMTAFEKKLDAVSELLNLGIEDNEVVVVAKVSKGGAAVAADKLELLEQQLRKLKLTLRKAAAVGGIAA